jgi:hypothetical protein
MAVESKPLFHPEVLRQQVRSFLLPEQTAAWQPKLEHWAELIRSGRAHQFKETQRTLLDWLRMEYGIEKPSNKLLALTELDSNTWVSEVKRIRGKKHPLSSAGLHALRDKYTRTIAPARALATETLTLERTLSYLATQAYGLTPAEIALLWQTAPSRMPVPLPFLFSGIPECGLTHVRRSARGSVML